MDAGNSVALPPFPRPAYDSARLIGVSCCYFSRISQLRPTAHAAVCYALRSAHADRVLVGGWCLEPDVVTNFGGTLQVDDEKRLGVGQSGQG